jgi:hypothetical protein
VARPIPNASARPRTGSPVAARRRNCSWCSALSWGFGGRQMSGVAGLPGRGTTLVVKFEFDFGQRGRDGRHGSSSRGCGVDAFPQRAQRNPCSPRSAIGRVTSATERLSRSVAATTTASPGRAKASIPAGRCGESSPTRKAGSVEQPLLLDPGDVQRGPLGVEVRCSDGAPRRELQARH